MLRILASPKRCCDGITRRDLLQAGGASLMGLGLTDLLAVSAPAAQRDAAASVFGRAKHLIILFLYGSPSQLDTLDPKPEAPEDIRGPFGTTATALSGVRISDQLPGIAQRLDKMTLVRSMSHPHPIHGVAFALTGIGEVDIPMELNRLDPRHWPSLGSVLEYVHGRDHPSELAADMPGYVHLPWELSSRSHPHKRAGILGGFLGPRYDPVTFEFSGTATRADSYRPNDPFCGIEPDCRFRLSKSPDATLTLKRIGSRRSLLEQFDLQRRHLAASRAGESLSRFQEMAFSMIASPRVHGALDLNEESPATRERYGHHLFGQSALLARRLVESGSRVVQVFWDEFGLSCGGWDTHEKATARLRDELCPGLDQTVAALYDDLHERGLLDETLVVCMGEHGRTPQPERRNGLADGRGHWSRAYSALFFGAGIAQGTVVGASDEHAAWVHERPVTPKDVLQTVYHLMGVDTSRTLPDRLARPHPLVVGGEVVHEMLIA